MKPVFLDTVGLVAVWDIDDQWHETAEDVYLQLLDSGRSFVTTSAVLFECGNAASRTDYRGEVCALRTILLRRKALIDPTPDELEDCWRRYESGAAGTAGIVDLISFAVMRSLSIDEAFSNDWHFSANGFHRLF